MPKRKGKKKGRGGKKGQDGGEAPNPDPRPDRGNERPPQQESLNPSSSSSHPGSSSLRNALEESVQIQDGVSENETAEFPAPAAASSVDSASSSAEKAPEAVLPLDSSKSVVQPIRPGEGSVGEETVVRANHFLVKLKDKYISQYSVKVVPEVKSRATGRKVMNKLIDGFGKSRLAGLKLAYDGRNIFYTAARLPFTSADFEVTVTESESRERTYTVSIEFTKDLDSHCLTDFLNGWLMDCPYDIIQALDVVLGEFPSKNYFSVSRSFFSPTFGRQDIGGGLECLQGYYQSLRPTQMGLSLNLDIAATSFYKSVDLVDFVLELLGLSRPPRPSDIQISEERRIQVNKILKGVRVETTHNSIHYKITGITSQPADSLFFTLPDKDNPDELNTEKSVAQYFKDRYKYNLLHPSYPCVQAGNSNKPVYLPMEVCKIVKGQRYSKKLNEEQVTKILNATCKLPAKREYDITKLWEQNKYTEDKHAKEFGMTVGRDLKLVKARILPAPQLTYNDNRGQKCLITPRFGKWSIQEKRMFEGGSVDSWACISFAGKSNGKATFDFLYELVGVCADIGMVFNDYPAVDVAFWPPAQIEKGLRNIYESSVKKLTPLGKHLQILIVVLPVDSGSYGRIKTICETELGLVTQCCQAKKVKNRPKQYLENIALKINVKVGGSNTVLVDAINRSLPVISAEPTIIFGADVTHPAPGDDSQSSIAAVVASMNWPSMTTYRCLLSSQQPRQEIIQDLFASNADPERGIAQGGMVKELLEEFHKVTKMNPLRIIFYRDGVSEGQYGQVLLHEVEAIRKACRAFEVKNYKPTVTFVVVQKRHHTRLFPVDPKPKDFNATRGNILPGTVVDTEICHPTKFDFYLCSHSGNQGTSRPTHYHVLYDENGFTSDELQCLTNNLCYTYARCARSVSVVPPAYYAHLAAFRARYYMEGNSENRSNRTAGIQPLPKIKDTVKKVMFYC